MTSDESVRKRLEHIKTTMKQNQSTRNESAEAKHVKRLPFKARSQKTTNIGMKREKRKNRPQSTVRTHILVMCAARFSTAIMYCTSGLNSRFI